MSIPFETVHTLDIQRTLDVCDINLDIRIEELTYDTHSGFDVPSYFVTCHEEADMGEIFRNVLNLEFDQPVICEREDVEDAISYKEYVTLKISDTRRFDENQELLVQIIMLKKEVKKLRDEANTPWYKKIFRIGGLSEQVTHTTKQDLIKKRIDELHQGNLNN